LTTSIQRLFLSENITLNDDDTVIIIGVESFNSISSIINKQSPRVLQNYMIWRFIMAQPVHMPKYFRAILRKFKAATISVYGEQSRAITCAEYVNKNMGYAVSKLYRNKYFDKSARTKVFAMIVDMMFVFFICGSH
jgi:predicted metalloendopeptidase